MPYPSKIDLDAIVDTARHMIETGGVDNLSLNVLAAELGVKTPSLYRYVPNKTALLRAINEATQRDLINAISVPLQQPGDAITRSQAIAAAYWDYAFANPLLYGLLYTNTIAELRPDETESEQAVLPFQAVIAEISGEAQSLTALRGFVALMHGFVMLVLAGQLRRGGDLQAAYRESITAYLVGLMR